MYRIASIFLLLTSVNVNAEDLNIYDVLEEKCGMLPQSSYNVCISEEYQKVDKELNVIFSEVKNDLLDPSSLVKAELEWMKFRDLSCKFENSSWSPEGSGYNPRINLCMMHFTKLRINDLKRYKSMKCNGCPERKQS
jgi:uncharacterized protein YecT (DUF1311 family)